MGKISDFEVNSRAQFAALSDDAVFEMLLAGVRVHPIEKLANEDFHQYDRWLREEIAKRTREKPSRIGLIRFYRGHPYESDAEKRLLPDVSLISNSDVGDWLIERFADESRSKANRPTVAEVIDERGALVIRVVAVSKTDYRSMPVRPSG